MRPIEVIRGNFPTNCPLILTRLVKNVDEPNKMSKRTKKGRSLRICYSSLQDMSPSENSKTTTARWEKEDLDQKQDGYLKMIRSSFLFIICLDYVLRTSIDKIRENGIQLTKKRSTRYPAKTIIDADYADDIAILANTPNQAKILLHSLERAAAGIGFHVNAHKTEYMCYNQTDHITTLDGTSLKLVDKFTYLGSSIWSTEKDIDKRLMKAWTVIDRLSIYGNQTWAIKWNAVSSMQRSHRYCCIDATTWTLTKWLEKKLDDNYPRMLRAILNKSWRQHSTRYQLFGHLPPIKKTIQVTRTRHAGQLHEKQGRAHKWCTPRDPHIWPDKRRTTCSNIHSAAMWGYGMYSWRPARGDER